MTSEEEDGVSSFDSFGENWRSALVVNSVEAERQRDELADMLSSNLQARPPLFGDNNNATAVDWSQDHNHPDSAAAAPAAPTHGDNRSNDRSDLVGSNGAGEQRTRRDSPRLLRHLLLARQPQPQQQPQSASTVTPSFQPNRSHCDEREAGTVRSDEWRSCLGDMDMVLPSAPSRRSRVGDLAEACRTRLGGEAKRGAEGKGSSTASIGSVGSELRGGELERVRGRVADLSAAVETSQAKLLQELSQVQEDFFSSFGYTPQVGSTGISGGGGAAFSFEPVVGRGQRWGFSLSRDSSPLRRRDLGGGTGEGPGITHTIDRWGDSSGRIARAGGSGGGRGGGSRSGSGATFVAARTEEGSHETFPAGLRAAFPEKGRNMSTSMLGSPTSRNHWSRDVGRGRVPLILKTGADELGKRLQAETIEKEALERELQETRREVEECHADREGLEKELDHLRKACRSAHDRAEALERSLSEHRQEADAKGVFVREAAEKGLRVEADRDRMAQEYEVFRWKAADRAVSLWVREKDRTSLRASISRWREVALRGARLEGLPVQLDSWRVRQALVRWRLKTRISASFQRASMAGLEQAFRRQGIICLRRWALVVLRKKRLRRLLRMRAMISLLRAWSQWKYVAAATAARRQKNDVARKEELLSVADAKVGMLETQLEQSKVRMEEEYTRIVAGRSKSLQKASNFRVMRAAFSDWSTHRRERMRARVLVSRLLHRRRRTMLAEGFRRLSVEGARSLVLERILKRHQATRVLRVTAFWWSRFVDGVGRSKRQKQALTMLLVTSPVRDAFERLEQRANRRRAARAALSRLCRSTEIRMVNALRHWSRQASASSSAAVTLSRLARRHYSRVAKEAFFRWRCAVARAREELSEDRMAVAEASLEREQGRARRAAAAALLGALRRDRRRSLVWGFGVFEEQRLVFEKKAFSRWRGQLASHALAAGAFHRLEGLFCRMEMRRAMQRWERAVESRRVALEFAGLVDRTVSRVFLARSWRRWHAECCRRRDAEVHDREDNRRRALCGRLQAGYQRTLLLRCLLEWKVQTVIGRCQLRSARSLRFARDHRTLRETFGAWRDGCRGRMRTTRVLSRVTRVVEKATLRAGFRRLVASARRKDHEEALAVLAAARLERDRALHDRDAINARLLEAADEARRVSRERALAEDVAETKLLWTRKRRTMSDCFSAWKAQAQFHQRRIACAQRLVRQLRRAYLRRAFSRWRDEARESALFGLMERLLARQGRRETLSMNLRAWYDLTKRSRRAENVLSRAVRVLSTLEKRRTHQAFWAWRTTAVLRSRRALKIISGCARLEGIGVRAGRLQLASAFTLWARFSSAAAYADEKAKAAAAARQRRVLRACLAALSRNASAQLRGRRALCSLDRMLRLRRLARGWVAITVTAATAVAASRARERLGTAEARVFAGRKAARAHTHRMAKRLLGLARGRTALDAFLAWKAFARQARGARLGARALAARTRRRILRDNLARWRARSLAMSRLRARTLTKLSTTTVELVACAFRKWRDWMHSERAKEAAVVALKRVCDRRRSDRVGKLLALRTWRENDFRGDELGSSGEVDVGTGEWDSGALEALAGVAVEAAAAFSSASSISRVFALVEEFVSMAVPVSRGHLLLLTTKPGGELSGLEFDRTVKRAREANPLEVSLPLGNGLVHRCVSTGLPCQTIKGKTSSLDSLFSSLSCHHGNQSFNKSDNFPRGAAADLYGMLPRVDLHKSCWLRPSDGSGSGVVSGPPSLPLDEPCRRSRLAFFPAPPGDDDEGDDSRSPSPAQASTESTRSTILRSTKPPRIPGLPKRPVSSEGCCASLRSSVDASVLGVSAGGAAGMANGAGRVRFAEDDEAVVVCVACVPVGGGGRRPMLGVLKAWRWQEEKDREKRRELSRQSSSPYFTAAEMAALVVLAGHASGALHRLEVKSAERKGNTEDKKEREAAVKQEVKSLREALEQISNCAKGLAQQRDEARAELSRAKGTLRRMVPALRDARDRQLGFRHYHDLIVNMSRSVLKEDEQEKADASPTRAQSGRSWRLDRGRSGKRAGSHSTGDRRGSGKKSNPVRSPSSPAALKAVEGAAGLHRTKSYSGKIDSALRILRKSRDQDLSSQENGRRCLTEDGERRDNAEILHALRETAAGGDRGENNSIPGSRTSEGRRT